MSKKFQLRPYLLTITSCVLITTLGIIFLANASSGATMIGENISTNDLAVTGNVTSGTWQGTAVVTQYGGTGQDFSGSTGILKLISGTASMVTDNSANWDTAYTYSQVGHLPLTGGTLSSDLTIQETGDAKLTIYSNTDSPTEDSKLLVIQKGATPTELFSVDEDGDVVIGNDLVVTGNVTSGIWQGTPITTQYGGTGVDWSAVVANSIPYFSNIGTLDTVSPGTDGLFLMSQGSGSAPTWDNVTRSATFVVCANDSLNKTQCDYLCDGIADDVQIQAAIDAVPTAGGKVLFLEGQFNISDTIFMKDKVTLEGMGLVRGEGPSIYAVTLLKLDVNANVDVIALSAQTEGFTLKHFGVDGNKGNQDGAGGHGINLTGAYHIWLENIAVLNAKQSGIFADDTVINTWDIFMRDIVSMYSGEHGFYFNNVICMQAWYVLAWHSGYNGFYAKGADRLIGYVHTGNSGEASSTNSPNANGIIFDDSDYMDVDVFTVVSKGMGICFVNCENIIAKVHSYDNVLENNVSSSIAEVSIVGSKDSLYTIQGQYTGARATDGVRIYSSSDYPFTNNKIDIAIGSGHTRYGLFVDSGSGYDFSGTIIRGRWEGSTAGLFLTNNLVLNQIDVGYVQNTNLFMDVLVASTTAVHTAITGTGVEQEIITAITNPDVPRNISITNSANSTGDVVITGVDAKGNSVTDTITISTGGTAYGVVAFSTVSKITIPATVANPDTIEVGISNKLGLSNIIYATSDVYKIKKNNADATVATAQVNTTYNTYDMSVIGLSADDDFTIYYKSNLNIIE